MFHVNHLPSRWFTWHVRSYLLWKIQKKKIISRVSSAAVVIGVLRANFVTISVCVHGSENNYAVWSVRFHLRFPCLVDVGNNMVFTLYSRTPWLSYGTIPKIWTSQYCCLLNLSKTCWMSSKQCGPWSPSAFCSIWSGSTLFAQDHLSQIFRFVMVLWIKWFWYYPLVLLNLDIPCLCKQCISRSVGFWRIQLILICTVCHSVYEFMSTISIKASDWLTFRNGRGLLIYSEWQGLTRL